MLQGAFHGKNTVVVEPVNNDDGKVKHLKFVGVHEDEAAVAAAGGEESA